MPVISNMNCKNQHYLILLYEVNVNVKYYYYYYYYWAFDLA
jgi:hypothetical protein